MFIHSRSIALKVFNLIALALLACSCASLPVTDPEPATQARNPALVEPVLPESEPAAAPVVVATPRHTAIIVSADIPVFMSIAEAISELPEAGAYSIHNLDGNILNTLPVLQDVREAGAEQVVAIGLPAAVAARQFDNMPVVFCQTYNYQDHDLLAPNSKGVSMLPPFEEQFTAWRQLSPELARVGVIAGPNQEDRVARITAAGAAVGVQVISREVSSDKETLLEFRRLVPEIQGLLLLPDNRILSPQILREIMSYAVKHSTQIGVYGSQMLGLGGVVSFSSVDSDVAQAALSRLNDVTASGELNGPPISQLSEIVTQINFEVAEKLGLSVPMQVAEAGAKD